MDAYFPVSNMQADTMQTLYLMNTSVGGYTDALVSENLMLSSNSTNTTSPTSDFSCNEPAHGQPVEMTFSLPSHESCRHVREKSAAQQQTLAANLLTLPLETRPFSSWLGGGNMLTYFQPADSNSSSHSINRDLNGTIGICHSNVAEIPQIEMRGHTLSSVNGHHSGLIPTQSCLQLDQPTTTALQRQGLSLSLSSQDTSNLQLASFRKHCSEFDVNCQGNIQPTLEENSLQTDTTVRKGMTASGVTGVMDSIHKTQENKEFQSSSGQFAGFFHSVKNSKYLAATQELLNEVLNLTKFESFKPLKQRKSQSLIGTTIEKENTGNKLGRKNLDVDGDRTHKDSMEGMDSPNKEEANVTERKELQNKKTKLVAMLDEVDWRYKQYHHQMQTVISSFEAVTQIGAAKTYTALALKTICRHFRSLRDAIVGQINVTSKELGEQHTSCSGDSGGSHVRLVQLGMIQPHAWRPQRGLPEKAVTVLRAWLFEHFLHPYPKDSDKLMLAKQAGLTRSQVSNWFINARVRLWKPMVEEMYMEELKETGLSIEKDSRFPIDEQANGIMERDSAKKLDDSGEQTEQKHIDGGAQNEIFEKPMIAENRDLKSQHPKTLKQSMDQRLDLEAESNAEISPEASDVGVGQGHLKKARNESKVSVNSLSNCSTIVNFSTSEGCQESVSVNLNNRVFSDNDFGLSQRDIVLSSQNSKSGPFELDCMNRFGNGSFISSFSGGNVSLTLGLQQSENLTLSKAQQRCVPSEGCFELGHYSDHLCNINDTAAIDASNSYNCDMENRKRNVHCLFYCSAISHKVEHTLGLFIGTGPVIETI